MQQPHQPTPPFPTHELSPLSPALLAGCHGLELTARFSESGIHGEVRFTADGNGTGVGTLVNTYLEVVDDLEASAETPDVWSWSIHEFPVDYSLLGGRCDNDQLGRRYRI